MRLDLVLPNEGSFMLEAVNAGPHYEAMGWDGLWLSDHLLGIAEDHLHQQAWLELMDAQADTVDIASHRTGQSSVNVGRAI